MIVSIYLSFKMDKKVFNLKLAIVYSVLILIGDIPLVVIAGTPTVVPADPFNDDIAAGCADVLKNALEPEDDDVKNDQIQEILTKCSYDQRKKIQAAYDGDIYKAITKNTSGPYQGILKAMFKSAAEFYVHDLHNAMYNLKSDDVTLITVLVAMSKTAQMKNDVVKLYQETYDEELGPQISRKTNEEGDLYQQIMEKILQKDRKPDVQKVDQAQAEKDADAIHQALENVKSDENKAVHDIADKLIIEPMNHLQEVTKKYKEKYGNKNEDLHQHLDDKFEDELGEVLRQLAFIASDEADHFAVLYQRAMKGMGTKNSVITRLTVIQSEINLADIQSAYQKRYDNSLTNRLDEEVSGDYGKFVMALCGVSEEKKSEPYGPATKPSSPDLLQLALVGAMIGAAAVAWKSRAKGPDIGAGGGGSGKSGGGSPAKSSPAKSSPAKSSPAPAKSPKSSPAKSPKG